MISPVFVCPTTRCAMPLFS